MIRTWRIRNCGVAMVLLALAAPLRAETIEINFDEVSAPGAFKQILPGFDNGPTLEYPEVTLTGCVILTHFVFGLSATSGVNICATCDTCHLGDSNPGPPTELPGRVNGVFTDPVESIDLDVINGYGGSSGQFTIRAIDSEGGVVATDTVVAAPYQDPGFVRHLSVTGADIKSFRLTTDLPNGYTFAMDTLRFELPGATSSGSVDSLILDRDGLGDLLLNWAPSCRVGDTDYAVYEGTLGAPTSHQTVSCSTLGATSTTLTPASGNSYYLVVPHNDVVEGSYGLTGEGVERGPGASSCSPQQSADCN